MAKPNYQFEKRQRDMAKKRKQEEKRQQKVAARAVSADTPSEPVEAADDGDAAGIVPDTSDA